MLKRLLWQRHLAKSQHAGRRFAKGFVHRAIPGQDADNELLHYFDAHSEGPGIWKWRHYFDIYERHFAKFRGREVHVLEVGIYSGGSLPMWQHYFGPQCSIYGVDIEPACKAYESEGVRVFIGDQADRDFWASVRQQVPRVDILIDDGGHDEHQQRATLEEMLPHLSPGGVYLCEDITSSNNGFTAYLSGLVQELNHFNETRSDPLTSQVCGFQKSVHSVHFYPFVCAIEKHLAGPAELIAPKHGTQWQPFFEITED